MKRSIWAAAPRGMSESVRFDGEHAECVEARCGEVSRIADLIELDDTAGDKLPDLRGRFSEHESNLNVVDR